MMRLLFLTLSTFFLVLSAEESVQIPLSETVAAGTGTWNLDPEQSPETYTLTKPGKIPKKPVRRPSSIRLLPRKAVGAVTLDLEAKTLAPETKGADVILVFGYQDPTHFYYAHISNDADGKVHSVIMKVDGEKGTRNTIHSETEIEPALKDGWQHLRLVRTEDGTTSVYVDDMETPHLTTKDTTWLRGQVGFGSFNDPAAFRNLRMRTPPPIRFEESFESGSTPVSGGKVSGTLAGSVFTENSAWTGSDIVYEVLPHEAPETGQFQRITMNAGTRMELLHYGVPCKPNRFYRLRVKVRGTEGTTIGLILSNPKDAVQESSYHTWWSSQVPLTETWTEKVFILPDVPMEDELRIGFNLSEPGFLDLEDYRVEEVDRELAIQERRAHLNSRISFDAQQSTVTDDAPAPPPWEEATEPTAADLKGPDGRWYPDFRYAGIPGGIPEVKTVVTLRDFGGIPNDDEPDHAAFEKAIAKAAELGGGAVEMESGTYLLEKPLRITQDNIVLRGAGMQETTIRFTYEVPSHSLEVVSHEPGAVVGYHDLFEIHAGPDGLKRITLMWNKKVLKEFKPGPHSGGTHWLTYNFFHAVHQNLGITSGPQVVTIEAEWDTGLVRTQHFPIKLDLTKKMPIHQIRFPNNPAAIAFCGDRWSYRGRRWNLAEDLKRGDTRMVLTEEPPLKPGDLIRVSMPGGHPDFLERTRSARKGIPRNGLFFVKEVEGPVITLTQPARILYPVDQGARAETVHPIRNVGAEGFTLEQVHKHWTHGVVLHTSLHSWIRDVRVNMAGRNPIDIGGSKQSEVRDCEFNDAWYLGGGGTGYITFTNTHDCLMENILTRRLRHAPNAQWGAQGNVFRNSTFIQSDAQFHMGWAVENLYENCVVDAARGSGSYGYALYVQRPEVEIHGPGGGPRNIMYYNDFKSPLSGVYLGGSNYGWKFLYNRMLVGAGPGMIIRDRCFEVEIAGNHVQLISPVEPFVRFEGAGSTQIEMTGNTFLSASKIWFEGDIIPTVHKDNMHWGDEGKDLPRPTPEVPSLFEWQREHHPLP